jgi:membrane protein YqaA with SNARE-associated domain
LPLFFWLFCVEARVSDELTLWGLFLSAFISSTLFPGGSEALLAVLVLAKQHSSLTLLTVATMGNVLGALTSYALGRIIAWRYPQRRLENSRHKAALERVRHWGSPVLLLSWLPLVGDPLCVAAGWLRVPVIASVVFITLGKLARYGAIIAAL